MNDMSQLPTEFWLGGIARNSTDCPLLIILSVSAKFFKYSVTLPNEAHRHIGRLDWLPDKKWRENKQQMTRGRFHSHQTNKTLGQIDFDSDAQFRMTTNFEGGFIVVGQIHFDGQIHFYPKWLTTIKPVLGLVILEVRCKKCDGILKLKCIL